ncbi:MAG: D-arabinono-1,4-lactone oxidase [Vezdaea aestivalis]|nr:MAG: D-arabinono-1,4-lactone oxidase [Vezdaea aestivalis]
MDPATFAALDGESQDGIPFRAVMGHCHQTWARTFFSRPELYFQPQSIQEIEKIVNISRRRRRRLVVVGSAHSPSDLTCSSSWKVNLDNFNSVISVDPKTKVAVVQSGISLHDLGIELQNHGLAMPSLGSIDDQSLAGAISTGTHGSSLQHGLLSGSVKGLRIMLANGRTVTCDSVQNAEIYQAALVSLGALGIIVEISFQAVPAFDIEWQQEIVPLSTILSKWNKDLWTQAEFVRVWWLPHSQRCIIWKAEKTTKPRREPKGSWYGGRLGFHIYQPLLYFSNWFPSLLPAIEWFVFGMQFGFKNQICNSAVQPGRTGLLMDCLYSQFVNEWSVPLEDGPEVLRRLSAWINHDDDAADLPVPSKGIYVHAPIEVRVSDTSVSEPRPFLDHSNRNGPTLYINATMYRAYHTEPVCKDTYYQAFEALMVEYGGKPHWAKNFSTVKRDEFVSMYGDDLKKWQRVRDQVDPDGLFVGEWHRRNILEGKGLDIEEQESYRIEGVGGGWEWHGERARSSGGTSRPGSSGSYEMMHGAEAASTYFEKVAAEESP